MSGYCLSCLLAAATWWFNNLVAVDAFSWGELCSPQEKIYTSLSIADGENSNTSKSCAALALLFL
jgi:hypothetical protein